MSIPHVRRRYKQHQYLLISREKLIDRISALMPTILLLTGEHWWKIWRTERHGIPVTSRWLKTVGTTYFSFPFLCLEYRSSKLNGWWWFRPICSLFGIISFFVLRVIVPILPVLITQSSFSMAGQRLARRDSRWNLNASLSVYLRVSAILIYLPFYLILLSLPFYVTRNRAFDEKSSLGFSLCFCF